MNGPDFAPATSQAAPLRGSDPAANLRWPAVAVVLVMLSLLGLQAAVVIGARSAHARLAERGSEPGLAERVAGFHFVWQGAATEVQGAEERVQLASLEVPLPPLRQQVPREIELEARLAAMLPPVPAPPDDRPLPWLGPDPVDTIIAALEPPRATFDERLPPALPEQPAPSQHAAPHEQPPLLEPHMQSQEDWKVRSRMFGHPGAQKVHFNGNVVARCLPSSLLKVLYDAAMRFGDIRVISGWRSPARNRAVGGASRSMHLECRAIDFYAPGAGKSLVPWLVGRKDVGGYKRYPFGSFHIDNGPRRTW